MAATSIEWTDHVWNALGIWGCAEVSPGCANCYAAKMAHRLVAMGRYPAGITEKRPSGVHWTGKVITMRSRIDPRGLPKRPARVFVGSMFDLFHPAVPDGHLALVVAAMAKRPHLTFQVLTKRPGRARLWWRQQSVPQWPANVWMGTSVENRDQGQRIADLVAIPAAVRFLSCEPLLGDPELARCRIAPQNGGPLLDGFGRRHDGDPPRVHWVIAGGEAGPRARPASPHWFRSIRDDCAAAGAAFFFKQWGAWGPVNDGSPFDPTRTRRPDNDRWVWPYGRAERRYVKGAERMTRRGKKANGSVLDGRVHRAFPRVS
jgi:protein gp37